ncbi:MAG: nucleotidyltransferase family protein [Gemmatimonadota bacterium]|nr:nucleotidyltransferase family protein [Gemmatimonadota bacterium]
MLSAIVLAAGRSFRMGPLKQLLPFGSTTVIERITSVLLASRIEETIIVLGHRIDEIQAQLAGYDVKIVRNPDPDGDMLSSVQCGVCAVAPGHGVMIVLGDQPLITTEMLDEMISFYEKKQDAFVIPVHEDKRGHPMIISPHYRDDILSLRGDSGLKELRDRYPEAINVFPVDKVHMLTDMDYYHEYEKALRHLDDKD